MEVSDLFNKLCSPYAIVIDQINNITTDSLWTLLWLWIFIFTLFMIVAVLYFSGYLLKPLKADIRKLSNRARECIDEDYKQATPIENLKIGTYCLYQKQPFTMRVYEYDNFIWIYQKETIAKKKGCFEVCAYDIQGNQYICQRRQERGQRMGKAYQRRFGPFDGLTPLAPK